MFNNIYKQKTKLEGDCWIWTGRVDQYGVGVLSETTSPGKQKTWAARRYFYHYLVHELQTNHRVYMNCGKKLCVNPEHMTSHAKYETSLNETLDFKYKPGRHYYKIIQTNQPPEVIPSLDCAALFYYDTLLETCLDWVKTFKKQPYWLVEIYSICTNKLCVYAILNKVRSNWGKKQKALEFQY